MRCTRDIFVAATATAVPPLVSVAEAERAGLTDELHTGLGYQTIAVSDGIAGPEFAVQAGRTALARSGLAAAEYDLLIHASLWFQGLDMWATAAYVANETIGAGPVSFDMQCRSAGGMAALRTACAYLESGFASTAMLTTGDNFAMPAFDRWNSQMYTIYGDGGSALALSTRDGFARVVSVAGFADNSLEGFGHGSEPFHTTPCTETPVPVMRRLHQHMRTPEAANGWERIEAGMIKTCDQVLADAGLTVSDIDRAVLPFIHRGGGQSENYDLLGFTEEQSVWDFGATVGHFGAGDQIAGLDHLAASGALVPGQRLLLFTAGVGFNFVAAVLEILRTPTR